MSFKPSVVRGHNSFDRKIHSDLFGLFFDQSSLTDQSQRDDADINVLVRRWMRTGVMPQVRSAGSYGDFTGVGDYQSALERVRAADDQFMTLPAAIRRAFGDDPSALLAALDDPSQHDELVRLGVLTQPSSADHSPVDKSTGLSDTVTASSDATVEGVKS